MAEPHEGVRVGIHRIGLCESQAQPHARDELGEERLFVLEVPIEEALRDTRCLADVDHARIGVPAAREQVGSLVEQLLLALATLVGEAPAIRRSRVHAVS